MPMKRRDAQPLLTGPEGATHVTRRQRAVLEAAVKGLTDKEIAVSLGLSVRTIQDRFAELRLRTGIRTRGQLLAHATAAGLVQPDVRQEPMSLTIGKVSRLRLQLTSIVQRP